MRIELTFGIIKDHQWYIAPKVEEYFHEGQAIERYVLLQRRADLANERLSNLGKDFKCEIFHHCYAENGNRDIMLELDFFNKVYDRLNYPELPGDIPLQRPLFFEANAPVEEILSDVSKLLLT